MAIQSRAPSKEIQKRISQRGAITDADIQDYINEVGLVNLSSMSMNDVEQFLKNFVSLGQQQKKRLPRKKKIEKSDSVVVADQKGGLAKVGVEDQKKAEASETPAQDIDPTKPNRFKGYAKAAGLGMLGLGSMAFNKMFPTLGALMVAFERKLLTQDKDLNAVNSGNQESARQVSRSSVFLSRIAESQLRTNELLEQIITAASAPGTSLVPRTEPNVNLSGDVDLRRRPPSAPDARRASTPQTGQSAAGSTTGSGGGIRTSAPSATPRAGLGSGVMIASMIGLSVTAAATSTTAATRPTAATPPSTDTQGNTLNQITSNSQPVQPNILYQTAPGGQPTAAATGQQTPTSNANNATGTPAQQTPAPNARGAAAPQAVEPAIPTLPTPPIMTREAVTRAGAPITEQEQAELFANRVLNIRAKDIIFKADQFEFDQTLETGGGGPVAPFVSSAAPAAARAGTAAAATGTTNQIQNVIQRITQEFPGVAVTSGLRPGDTNSQHATGNAVDLSLRGLTQEQRATLVQNITTGRYGNIGGLGTYNAAGDLLHVDTRSGPRMAWGPNRSRTSLDQTPQWFQTAVSSWAGTGTGGSMMAAGATQEQEPRPGGEQQAVRAAIAAPSAPTRGTEVAQASVRSEVSMMQSQQVTAQAVEGPSQPATPTGSMEQSATAIDPNEPGAVEPPDAAQRYARLFDFAA